MNVKNAHQWAPGGWRPWLAAFAALGLATTVRTLLHPLIGPVMPGTAFCIAASLIEYYYGLAPALTVMALGLGIADVMFVPPYFQITTVTRADIVLAVSYPLVTLFVITLIERLRRAQYRAELLAAVAASRYDMLLRLDNERELARRAEAEARALLREVAGRLDMPGAIGRSDERAQREDQDRDAA